MIGSPALKIDPKHVYIVGLSSGGAMALDVACKAPDVFAGVGAIAGPSVGSNQDQALVEDKSIPATNVDNAVRKCKELAGAKAPHLDTQVANIAFGDKDRNGQNQGVVFGLAMPDSEKRRHAGQIALVSVRWSEDNAKVFQKLYGTDNLSEEPAASGFSKQRVARKNGMPRISLWNMSNIGHAWPAGTGQPNPIPPTESIQPGINLSTATRGIWLAQSGASYISHAASWLIASNRRPLPVMGMPVVNVTAKAADNKIDITGTATDSDGSIKRIDTVLLKETSGTFQQADAHGPVPFDATNGSYADSFGNLANGRYRIQAVAMDNADNAASAIVEVTLGAPQQPLPCFIDNNFNHVQKGRAVQCGSGFTCAKGSGDNLGLFNLFVQSSLEESSPGFFKKSACASL